MEDLFAHIPLSSAPGEQRRDLFDDIPFATANVEPRGAGLFDDIPMAASLPAEAPPSLVDRLKGAGRALASGVDAGVAGMAGLPIDAARGVQYLRNLGQARVQRRPFDDVAAENDARAATVPFTGYKLTRDNLEALGGAATHARSPLAYEPQNTAERYVHAVGEFLPGSVIGGGSSIARNAVAYGVAPAIASEAAGQAAQGTPLEVPARIAAGVLAAGAGHVAIRPNTAEAAVQRAAAGLTNEQLGRIESLMQDAQAAGVPLSRAEAAQAVTNGATRLGDLQRVAEGNGAMREFYARRPEQVEDAGRKAFDAIAPVTDRPSTIGPAAGQVAQGEIATTQRAINDATRPLYQAAEGQRVGPQVHVSLIDDPLYAQTLKEVRDNPALNRTIENLPDDAVGTIDLVRRRMREKAEGAAAPGQASTSNTEAASFRDAMIPPTTAAEAVTGGASGPYVRAREAQAYLRDKYLAPLEAGPIGRLAQKDITTRQAVDALFPANPLPNSAAEVGDAVGRLAASRPDVARQLVRTHAESVFNEATSALQGGLNQYGGAGFAAALRGNPQAATNLAAAVNALPNGSTILAGFDRFLDVMAATGQRQRIGSQTAFNSELNAALKDGGTLGKAATLLSSAGTKLPAMVQERLARWNLGSNVEEVARILTDPEAASLFRHLASTPPTSTKAVALISRLSAIGARSRQGHQPEGR